MSITEIPQTASQAAGPASDSFDLDVTTVAAAPRAQDLLCSTDDNCTSTPASAGIACWE